MLPGDLGSRCLTPRLGLQLLVGLNLTPPSRAFCFRVRGQTVAQGFVQKPWMLLSGVGWLAVAALPDLTALRLGNN